MQVNFQPVPRDHALVVYEPRHRIVLEPGTWLKRSYVLTGVRHVMQPCDMQGLSVNGQRIPVGFDPDHQYPRDRSRYFPHQGKAECARRVRQSFLRGGPIT